MPGIQGSALVGVVLHREIEVFLGFKRKRMWVIVKSIIFLKE